MALPIFVGDCSIVKKIDAQAKKWFSYKKRNTKTYLFWILQQQKRIAETFAKSKPKPLFNEH